MYSPSAWWYTMDNNTFAASHGGKNPCAQISSNIEDHSPFWSHGQGMKHCTPSFLSFAFECARYWLHKFGLYRLQQRWNIYDSNFQITNHIITTNILRYVSNFPCQANAGCTQPLVFTFSFYTLQVQDYPDKMLQMSWYKHTIFTIYIFFNWIGFH